jgi:phosphoribosyl-ATP pyrophosphohydrolase/phosphoribosyl-AMP cyclohydrolase/histidinol dehydrogenase
LSTSNIARTALSNGYAVCVGDIGYAADICNSIAPEHLELHIKNAQAQACRFTSWGALFIGSQSAEVLGDYGAGPNHTLPTGGGARFKGGLSVFDFLRIRTWLRIDDAAQSGELLNDAGKLAQIEGLAGHALAARIRLRP